MKKFLLPLLFAIISVGSYAQDDQTCLQAWLKVFKERGADAVGDGMHRNVIVSVKDSYGTNCFYGKARVEGQNVTSIFIQYEDSNYKLFEAADFSNKSSVSITNGVSEVWVTKEENKAMRVLFIEKIKPKEKQFKQAPMPDPDKI